MTPPELRARRAALGLSLTKLGARLGVYRQTVHRWEAGTRAIPALLDGALQTIERAGEHDGQ